MAFWKLSDRSSLPPFTVTRGVGYSITDARLFRLDAKLWPKPSAWPNSCAVSSAWRSNTMSRCPCGMAANWPFTNEASATVTLLPSPGRPPA